MNEEQEAELRYEAGMYQSLYEKAKDRIEVLETALREIVKICDVRIHRLSLVDEIQQHARAAFGRSLPHDKLDATIKEMKRRHEE